MGKIYGYCRISTRQQNIERQVRNIQALYKNAIIIKEIFTGTKFQGRKELDKLLSKVSSGDTIVFDSVSRMSRSAEDGFALYKKLYADGINLIFLKEPQINTDTYKSVADSKELKLSVSTNDYDTDRLIEGIFASINAYILRLAEKQIQLAFQQAQKEVDDLHQRTREGMETARLNGKQIGLPKGSTYETKKAIQAKQLIKKYSKNFEGNLSDKECIKLIGIARGSYYKYKKEIFEVI